MIRGRGQIPLVASVVNDMLMRGLRIDWGKVSLIDTGSTLGRSRRRSIRLCCDFCRIHGISDGRGVVC